MEEERERGGGGLTGGDAAWVSRVRRGQGWGAGGDKPLRRKA